VAAAGPPACLLRRLGPKPPPAPPHAEILGFCNFISHSSEEQSLRAAAVQEYMMFSNIYDLTAVLENR